MPLNKKLTMQYTVDNLKLTLSNGEKSKMLKSSPEHPLLFTSPECRVVFMEAEDHFNGKVGSRGHGRDSKWVGSAVRDEVGYLVPKSDYWIVKLFGRPFGEVEEQFGCGFLQKPQDIEYLKVRGSLELQDWLYPPVEKAFAEFEGKVGAMKFKVATVLGVEWIIGRLATKAMFAVELHRVLEKPKARIQYDLVQYDLDFNNLSLKAARVTQWWVNINKSWAIPVNLINGRGFREINGLPPAPPLPVKILKMRRGGGYNASR